MNRPFIVIFLALTFLPLGSRSQDLLPHNDSLGYFRVDSIISNITKGHYFMFTFWKEKEAVKFIDLPYKKRIDKFTKGGNRPMGETYRTYDQQNTAKLNKFLESKEYAQGKDSPISFLLNTYSIRIYDRNPILFHILDDKKTTFTNRIYFEISDDLGENILAYFNDTLCYTVSCKEEATHCYSSPEYFDRIKGLMVKMLNDKAIRAKLITSNQNLKNQTFNTTFIPVTPTPEKIADVMKAVVTIKSQDGHGSGCIISKDGYVITNYHVISQLDSSFEIVTNQKLHLKFEVINSLKYFDLALLKIKSDQEFSVLSIGSYNENMIGENVTAIGTPASLELGQTITKGVVSGDRKAKDITYIQTDVSINPGNSGGALINDKRELIGIVNAKLVGYSVERIGFAISINDAIRLLNIQVK